MSLEINEENDFDYIQNYLKSEVREDFIKFAKPKVMDKDFVELVYKHFELYNKHIQAANDRNEYLTDENRMIKKALSFNSELIKQLTDKVNQNTLNIEQKKDR